jgi:23S rRNA (adenine2503-C2)-methyltransferase
MGMGEPLLNYEPTVKALRLLHKEIGISARHLTVSTIGHVPGIRRLAVEGLPVTLAVSLHAPTDELRHRLIPGMTNWSIAEIIDACRDYVSRTGRRLTVEYCLIEGVNDAHAQALQLSELLRGINCHVNLIPFNPFEGIPFKGVSAVRAKEFLDILSGRGVQVTARVKKGAEIDAACGQLRRRQGVDRAGSSEADY